MPQREAIFLQGGEARQEWVRYSAAIRFGDRLFVSGQVGSRPDNSPGPDFAMMLRQSFANPGAMIGHPHA